MSTTSLIPEITYCFSSTNRIKPGPPGNETNDIVCDVKMTQNRPEIKALEVASIEFDAVQRLIEPEWSRVYMSTGIPILDAASQTVQLQSFLARRSRASTTLLSDILELTVPLNTNPMISQETSGASTVFTTAAPHLLASCLPLWDWGQPVIVGGLSELLVLTSATVTVLSPTTFQVGGLYTGLGFLYYPVIPSYPILSGILNALLLSAVTQAAGQSQFQFCWAADKMTIRCFWGRGSLQVATGSLMNQIGFGANALNLITVDAPISSVPGYSLGISSFQLPSSNYDLPSLTAELGVQLNRFYFTQPTVLVLADQGGIRAI